jgi:hypothetical protein
MAVETKQRSTGERVISLRRFKTLLKIILDLVDLEEYQRFSYQWWLYFVCWLIKLGFIFENGLGVVFVV